MGERKNIAILAGIVLSVSLIAASVTAFALSDYHNRAHIRALGQICGEIIENRPDAEQAVLSVLKDFELHPGLPADKNILSAYGYESSELLQPLRRYGRLFALAGFLAGGDADLFQVGEDDFSRLQDEIYKTVTELYQTRDAALAAKNNFADNLYNIAHQIKTPITSISLSEQMLRREPSPKHLDQIRLQLARLAYLEEALLLLSRIDAGALVMERREADVFTVLTLAADNLQELFLRKGVSADIPESGEITIMADMDWTMEAVMNLLKNCMEHTPEGGAVHCAYDQNPLYTRIRIWDEGPGFVKEDIPHLFERFYRGRNVAGGGIGIGLALSRAIIESQNGTVSASNLPGGGACFEIRMYG